MKVICIATGWQDHYSKQDTNAKGPVFGEEVHVKDYPGNPNYYDVWEYPFDEKGNPQSFNKDQFVPTSQMDETTFERNYNLKKA